jgi:hypothetical protein
LKAPEVGTGRVPECDDVTFDHSAVEGAAAACDATALRLRSGTGERRALSAAATEQWRGRFRSDFDAAEPLLVARADHLEAELRRLAAALRSAATAATKEQHRRETERAEWHLQHEHPAQSG